MTLNIIFSVAWPVHTWSVELLVNWVVRWMTHCRICRQGGLLHDDILDMASIYLSIYICNRGK